MSITLNQIKQDKRSLSVPYGDQEINIVYKPSEWTPSIEEEWSNSEGTSAFEPILNLLPRLIVSWDIYEDEEKQQVVPLSYETFRVLPNALIIALIGAIGEDTAPGKESKTSSSGTSRRRN